MKKHYVYIIEERGSVTDLSVKIGVSSYIDRRVSDMQIGNPRILRLALKFGPFSEREAFAVEKNMHRCFSRFHVRGEWFDAVMLQRMDLLEDYERNQIRQRRIARRDKHQRKREKSLANEPSAYT